MRTVFDLIAILTIIVGTGFSIIGVVGFWRFPDVYMRLHTTGKVGIFGVVLLLVAAAVATPLAWSKALAFIILLLIVGPVTAHALASSAYRVGIEMHNPVRDDLESERHLEMD